MISALSLLPLVSALLSAFLCVAALVLPTSYQRQTRFFILLMASTALYSFGYFLRLNLSPELDLALAAPGTALYVAFALALLGTAASPTYWFLFAAELSGRHRWSTGRGAMLAYAQLVFTLAVGLTNPWHHLFVAGQRGLHIVYGPLVRVHHIAAAILACAGFWFALTAFWSRSDRRWDAVALGVSAFLPFGVNVIWTTRDMTGITSQALSAPVLMPLSTLVLAVLVFRSGLGGIVPAGVVNSIMDHTDSLLAFVDPALRFVSANSAFLAKVGKSEVQLAGLPMSAVMRNEALLGLAARAQRTRDTVEHRGWPNPFGGEADGASYWNWSFRPVTRKHLLQGFVLSLSEVSEEVRSAELESTLSSINQRLHSSGHATTEYLPPLVGAAGKALGAEVCMLALWVEGEWRVKGCESEGDWGAFDAAWPPLRLAIQTRRPAVVSDLDAERESGYEEMRALGLGSALAVPILLDGQVEGAILFGSRSPGVSRRSLSFARGVARSIALAAANARLHESERFIAGALQEGMVSVPEAVEGLEAGYAYRSATRSAKVGGDFFDVFSLDRDRVALLIGDVSGKGVQAATVGTVIRSMLRCEATHTDSPGEVLNKVNQALSPILDSGRHATVFFAILDRASGQMVYSSAGHPAPLIVRASGAGEVLEDGSAVLGSNDGRRYTDARLQLGTGDLLFMYTDGLTAAAGHPGDGHAALAGALATVSERRPPEVVEHMLADALGHADALDDDVAVLAVRLGGS